MGFKLFLVLMVFLISTLLFNKASGGLSPRKLNIISYIYYLFCLTTLLGGSLIFLGFHKHYMIKSMMLNESTINVVSMYIGYTAIILPSTILLVQKLFRVKAKESYDKALDSKVIVEYEGEAFLIVSIAAMVCIMITIYLFSKMGRIPLFDLVFNRGINVNEMRRVITTTEYINFYFRNIIVLTMTPLLSYFTFIYWMATKEKKWMMLFGVLFTASVLIKTYDYAKSPLVFYLAIYLLIFIVMKGSIQWKWLLPAGGLMLVIILFMYSRSGFDLHKATDIYNGPIGRTVFTSVATLFLHFDLFPKYLPFLAGRSLAPTMIGLMGLGLPHVRSGRVVMEFYSPFRVASKTGGVMNSMFVGEAYANFGHLGAIMAPILVGILLALAFGVILKMRKTPQNIMIYIVLVIFFSTALNGGFTDFIYNFNLIFILLCIVLYNILLKLLNKFSKVKI